MRFHRAVTGLLLASALISSGWDSALTGVANSIEIDAPLDRGSWSNSASSNPTHRVVDGGSHG